MKKGYVMFDDNGDIVCIGDDEWKVKDVAFDALYNSQDDTEWNTTLEDVGYDSTEDLKADTVMRGFDDLWNYMGWYIQPANFAE